MPLLPEYARYLRELASLGSPQIWEVPLEHARATYRQMRPRNSGLAVSDVRECSVPVQGDDITVRVYTPNGELPQPALVYCHGGGWVIGDLDTADTPCRFLCRESQSVVVSVAYRRAPEHRFPVAAEDAYAALLWTVAHAEELGIDRKRVAVAGDSAGGNLAAVSALMGRDRAGPGIAFQLLINPVTDGRSLDTESYLKYGEGYVLERAVMRWFWDQYVPDPSDRRHPYASPLASPDLSGLPPALVMTAEFDPLRSEGAAYGARLTQFGVRASVVDHRGFMHDFVAHTETVPAVRKAMERACKALKSACMTDSENARQTGRATLDHIVRK